MNKVLDYFSIEGAVGGSQEWFRNVVMYIGGCAAATACDCCIYLALHRGLTKLYPYDVHKLTKKDYINFSMKMKPFLKPRVNGVNKLWMFTEGLGNYLSDVGEQHISMKQLNYFYIPLISSKLLTCNLRRTAATGAFASGHPAEPNGHLH